MRTRNHGVRPVLRVAHYAIAAAAAGLTLAVAGCGGGGDNTPPSFTRAAVVTNPTTLTYVGGAATASVDVTDSSGVKAGTVMVDVKDSTGVSLTGGPQAMNLTAGTTTYSYGFNVPNNIAGTANKVYSVTVTAQDMNGNAPISPVVVGTVTVPFPPAHPGGP